MHLENLLDCTQTVDNNFYLDCIAIFSTNTDCSGLFDWSMSRLDWLILLSNVQLAITGKIGAKIDDCAVFHDKLVLAEGSDLPLFMKYDVYS